MGGKEKSSGQRTLELRLAEKGHQAWLFRLAQLDRIAEAAACAADTTDPVSAANQLSAEQLSSRVDPDADDLVLDKFTDLPEVAASGGLSSVHSVTTLRLDPVTEVAAGEYWRVRYFSTPERGPPVVHLELCKVEALFVIVCNSGDTVPAILIRPMHLDKKKSQTGRMQRLRPTHKPLDIVCLQALIERLSVLPPFAAADPPLRSVRRGNRRTVPRKEPAAREWLRKRDGAAPVLIPFGGRGNAVRQCWDQIQHELGEDREGTSGDSDESSEWEF